MYFNFIYLLYMNKYTVEFIGTVFIVLVIISTGHWALIGLALAVSILLAGKTSDGAFTVNPAVTLALYANNKLSLYDLLLYVFIEMLAAVVAVLGYNLILFLISNKN